MDLDGYPMQVLVTIAKGCRPNSPYPDRMWTDMKPPAGLKIPALRKALTALVRAKLVDEAVKGSYKVKPSRLGYVLLERWKHHHDTRASRRPVMFDPVRPQMMILDQRFNRWEGYR